MLNLKCVYQYIIFTIFIFSFFLSAIQGDKTHKSISYFLFVMVANLLTGSRVIVSKVGQICIAVDISLPGLVMNNTSDVLLTNRGSSGHSSRCCILHKGYLLFQCHSRQEKKYKNNKTKQKKTAVDMLNALCSSRW